MAAESLNMRSTVLGAIVGAVVAVIAYASLDFVRADSSVDEALQGPVERQTHARESYDESKVLGRLARIEARLDALQADVRAPRSSVDTATSRDAVTPATQELRTVVAEQVEAWMEKQRDEEFATYLEGRLRLHLNAH